MAWLLQPGDPLPALALADGSKLPDFSGYYAIVAVAPGAVPLPAQLPAGLRWLAGVDEASARRLGALPGEAMVVLCDPRGCVVTAAAGEDLQRLLMDAVELARARILA